MKNMLKWEDLSDAARSVLELTLSDDMKQGVTVNFVLGKDAQLESNGDRWNFSLTPELLEEISNYAKNNEYGDVYNISRLKKFVSVRLVRLHGTSLTQRTESVQL